MHFSSSFPRVAHGGSLHQAGAPASETSIPAAPQPQSQSAHRPSSEPALVHATGRRMSPALQRQMDKPASGQQAPRPGIRALPPELLSLIALELPSMDRLALSEADPRVIYPAIRQEAHAAALETVHAPKVNTIEGFKSLLQKIEGLPNHLQAGPLEVLGAHISRLPENEQQAAIDAFLPAARRLPEPRTALLDDLMRAAEKGPEQLIERQKALVDILGAAKMAVKPHNLNEVVRRYGITDHACLYALEQRVLGPLWDHGLPPDTDVRTAVKQLGITTERGIAEVAIAAAHHDSLRGKGVLEAARQHGISDEAVINQLKILFDLHRKTYDGDSASMSIESYSIGAQLRKKGRGSTILFPSL